MLSMRSAQTQIGHVLDVEVFNQFWAGNAGRLDQTASIGLGLGRDQG